MAKAKPLPSRQELQESFTYVPKTGLLYHNRLGRVVGNKKRTGIQIHHKGCDLYAHRVAWKLVTGKDPAETIDHINRDPFDNRWTNLREATAEQQNRNRVVPSRHLKGAFPSGNRWKAQIRRYGKKSYVGTFDTEMEAHLAYCLHAKRIYGEFACLD